MLESYNALIGFIMKLCNVYLGYSHWKLWTFCQWSMSKLSCTEGKTVLLQQLEYACDIFYMLKYCDRNNLSKQQYLTAVSSHIFKWICCLWI